MRRLIILALILLVAVVVASPTSAQSNKRVYISNDNLMMFEYPAEWEVFTLPLSLRLVDANPSAGENPTIRVDVVYPGTRGLRRGEYAGLQPIQVIEEFQLYLRDLYTFTPIVERELLNKSVAYTTTGNDTILLMVLDLGRNNIGLMVAYTPGNSVSAFEDTLLSIAQTSLYLGPEAEPDPTRPIIVPSGEPETPSEAVEPEAVGMAERDLLAFIMSDAVRPAALVADDDPSDDGMLFLYYGNGDLALFSGGIAPIDISNVRFSTTDGNVFFDGADFGYMMQRLFIPGACIHVRSVDQPYAAPEFCSDTASRELIYLNADTPTRQFVWQSALNATDTFIVQQDNHILGTCTISAGECVITMPPSPFALLVP